MSSLVWLALSATQLTALAAHAAAAGDAPLAGTLTALLAERAATADADAACRAAARSTYGEAGALEIDDEAVVSHGAQGAYVMAWTFVSRAMCPDAGDGPVADATLATADAATRLPALSDAVHHAGAAGAHPERAEQHAGHRAPAYRRTSVSVCAASFPL